MVVCKLLWSVLFSLFAVGYVCVSWRRLSRLREFTFPLHVRPDTSSLELLIHSLPRMQSCAQRYGHSVFGSLSRSFSLLHFELVCCFTFLLLILWNYQTLSQLLIRKISVFKQLRSAWISLPSVPSKFSYFRQSWERTPPFGLPLLLGRMFALLHRAEDGDGSLLLLEWNCSALSGYQGEGCNPLVFSLALPKVETRL